MRESWRNLIWRLDLKKHVALLVIYGSLWFFAGVSGIWFGNSVLIPVMECLGG